MYPKQLLNPRPKCARELDRPEAVWMSCPTHPHAYSCGCPCIYTWIEFCCNGIFATVILHHINILFVFSWTQIRNRSYIISNWSWHLLGLHQVYSNGFLWYNLSSGGSIWLTVLNSKWFGLTLLGLWQTTLCKKIDITILFLKWDL